MQITLNTLITLNSLITLNTLISQTKNHKTLLIKLFFC